MKRGVAFKSALRRFEHEAQLLARLRHPAIAQVHEAGTYDDGTGGVPYFAMEYIPQATPFTEYATANKLATRQRLELFIQVCEAVHHGHQKGIIHRDLKPSNILVDSAGQPKVIDFGVARSTDSDVALTTMETSVGQLIGTLQYMSPEQCAADPHDLDIRSDVYSLGAVLYELLCGRVPYEVSSVQVYEAVHVIREQTPTRPRTIDRTLRGDLETTVLKALEKDRERRYQSAVGLARDIRHYLAGEPIEAKRDSEWYVLRKTLWRYKVPVGVSAAFVVLLAVASAVSLAMWQRAVADRKVAQFAEQEARDAQTVAIAQRDEAERQRRQAERNEDLAKISALRSAYDDRPAPESEPAWSIATADLDGDGDGDLAVVNTYTDKVSVLLNRGDATFAAPVSYAVGAEPLYVAIKDLDGDGDADLAVANANRDNISVLLNHGDGTFAAQVTYAVGYWPCCLAIEDLDGDEDADLAVASRNLRDVSVLLNRGDGTFATEVNYPTGNGPVSVAIADLDGDGDSDLAVAADVSDAVSVVLNHGDGTFAPPVTYAVGDGPSCVAITDLDQDGDEDLAVVNRWTDNISVLLNHGGGTFAPQVTYPAGYEPHSVAIGDLDEDGDPDLAVATFRGDELSILLNRGDGTFAERVTYAAGDASDSIAIGDLDGDGVLDVAVANVESDNVSVLLIRPEDLRRPR